MTLDEAFRRAELEQQQGQFESGLGQRESEFAREMEFRVGQAETEQERFDAMMELFEKYFGNKQGGTGTSTPPSGQEGNEHQDGPGTGPNGELGEWSGGQFYPYETGFDYD